MWFSLLKNFITHLTRYFKSSIRMVATTRRSHDKKNSVDLVRKEANVQEMTLDELRIEVWDYNLMKVINTYQTLPDPSKLANNTLH